MDDNDIDEDLVLQLMTRETSRYPSIDRNCTWMGASTYSSFQLMCYHLPMYVAWNKNSSVVKIPFSISHSRRAHSSAKVTDADSSVDDEIKTLG